MYTLIDITKPVNLCLGDFEKHQGAWKSGKYQGRITIQSEDGGPFLVKTGICTSPGVRERKDEETGSVYGSTMQLIFDSTKDNELLKFFQRVITYVRTSLQDYEMFSFENVGGFLFQRQDGEFFVFTKVCEGRGIRGMFKTLLTRVDDIEKPRNRIPVDKKQVTDCCKVQAILNFDSVSFYEGKATIKVEVFEANIEEIERQTFL